MDREDMLVYTCLTLLFIVAVSGLYAINYFTYTPSDTIYITGKVLFYSLDSSNHATIRIVVSGMAIEITFGNTTNFVIGKTYKITYNVYPYGFSLPMLTGLEEIS
jgi:hypothetical protein